MRWTLVLALGFAAPMGAALANEYASVEFFEREVRPLLANHCYECHDAENAEGAANLRLDYGGAWTTGGDSGPAIDANHPEQSLLLRAVSYDDPDLQMPPKSKLSDAEIATLRHWIDAGAVAPQESADAKPAKRGIDIEARRAEHWAWQPVERPAVPAVADESWPQDDVDRFVLARLEQAKLAPAEPADPAAWLRRVTFDLTGLPPTAAEVREFLADGSPEARAKVVDRLLANPAFGECWAQHWLDLMRFAETKGHEQDFEIPYAWRYRDYVIRAMNANVPYDQFLREHIAGDLLPEPRVDDETHTNQSIQATGWWHLGEATHSPVDIRGEEAVRIDNQIDVFGKAFLGMTVACARCHDHKFDAISTADYYALCGFVQSSSYQEANIADPRQRHALAEQLLTLNQQQTPAIMAAMAGVLDQRLELFAQQAKQGQWSEPQRGEMAQAMTHADHPWHLLAVAIGAQGRGVTVAEMLDSELSSPAPPPTYADGTIVDFQALSQPIGYDDWRTSGEAFGPGPQPAGAMLLTGNPAQPLQVLAHSSATNLATSPRFTGLYRTRTFAIASPRLWYRVRGKADVFLDVDSHRTVAGPLHGVVRQTIDTGGQWQWIAHATEDYMGHRVHVDFRPTGEFSLAEVRQANEQPKASPTLNPAVARAVRESSPQDIAQVVDVVAAALRSAVASAAEGHATPDELQLVAWLLDHDALLPAASGPALDDYQHAVAEYQAKRQAIEQQIPPPQFAIALLDGSGEDEYVHLRGSHNRLAPEPTTRRMLTALGGEFPIAQGSGRLELADQLTDPKNPLVARTMVNRLWLHLMGEGVVPTVDNLGVLGRQPTHPELLDYLASEYVDSGWDTKAMIRRLVLSSTYAEASRPAPSVDAATIEQADPANQLLHMARVRRVPAEAIRDSLFAIAGELDPKMYGPSVEVEITDFMRHNRSPAGSGPMDGDRRRSLYIKVRRNALNHFLAAFDKPMPSTAVGRRNRSNSAAQPLMLLNDPLVHHLMGIWSTKLTAEYPDDTAAIEQAYLAAYGRPVTAAEQTQIIEFLTAEQAAGESRQQAWQDVCLALVNSKEFVFLQ